MSISMYVYSNLIVTINIIGMIIGSIHIEIAICKRKKNKREKNAKIYSLNLYCANHITNFFF